MKTIKEEIFKFKQFSIAQEQTAMKVGTDGVLLGAWANINHARNILDVGTGTGLIALMCAQKQPFANIDAVELDPAAARQAIENFKNSPWSNQLKVIQTDFQSFTSEKKYDVIISNPPYFDENTSSPEIQRRLARHTQALTLSNLIRQAKKMLKPQGNIQLILPADKQEELTKILQQEQLYLNEICYVKGHPTAKIKRIMIKFSKNYSLLTENHLTIEYARHQYTEDYIRLTRDFYLKM